MKRIEGLLVGQGIYDFEPLGADLMRGLAETAQERDATSLRLGTHTKTSAGAGWPRKAVGLAVRP